MEKLRNFNGKTRDVWQSMVAIRHTGKETPREEEVIQGRTYAETSWRQITLR